MEKYKSIDVTEKQLEDLLRQAPELIEEGLKYIDHQRNTDRGPLDVLMADSGNSLVVAELKITEDDGMLWQGIDYYDYIARNLEGLSRVYKSFNINPKQPIRLFLIAPSFSVNLLNRCKWISDRIKISLFTYKCISFEKSKDIVPVFTEISPPSTPETIVASSIEGNLEYITDKSVRKHVNEILAEIQSWDTNNISFDPTKSDISLKISGRVFSYLAPRRNYFLIYTYDNQDKWTGFPINQKEDMENVNILLKSNIQKLGK